MRHGRHCCQLEPLVESSFQSHKWGINVVRGFLREKIWWFVNVTSPRWRSAMKSWSVTESCGHFDWLIFTQPIKILRYVSVQLIKQKNPIKTAEYVTYPGHSGLDHDDNQNGNQIHTCRIPNEAVGFVFKTKHKRTSEQRADSGTCVPLPGWSPTEEPWASASSHDLPFPAGTAASTTPSVDGSGNYVAETRRRFDAKTWIYSVSFELMIIFWRNIAKSI